jgi:hypothetical protein
LSLVKFIVVVIIIVVIIIIIIIVVVVVIIIVVVVVIVVVDHCTMIYVFVSFVIPNPMKSIMIELIAFIAPKRTFC